jgi:tetratricopeptide (TPR) repeat protein/predicted Ser/Thr protein kinase
LRDNRAVSDASQSEATPPIGSRMGRYVVLSTLGMGAMGVVLAAYDPDLDRKAALKLMRPRGSRTAVAQARLAREAQALAKLNHPNVVTIYDVGMHQGQVFVAMEFVAGMTLREWMATPRRWQDVVRVFAAAGRGLAAAHEVGLVHRDFKPENVMIDARERVRVMDFGLARGLDDATAEDSSVEMARAQLEPDDPDAISALRSTSLADPLTRTDALVGTPAYMAPEQWLRLDTTPHTDQFSFCVALDEALHGRHPFGGVALEARARAVLRSEIVPPPRTSKVPSHVRRVVLRGLARRASERYPSMHALLDALADDPRIRWRRRGLATLAVALPLASGWALWQASTRPPAAELCSGGQAQLDTVWNETRKTGLRASLERTGLGYAADTAQRVEQRLDAYTLRWVAAHRDACEAHQRGEQSGTLLDARMRCLDERLQHVEATVEILSEANPDIVRKAIEAVAGLPSLERCADAPVLLAELPPPDDPELARRVAALDEQLIAAETARRTGEYERGRTLAQPVIDAAQELDAEPLRARAWLIAGKLDSALGDYAAAEQLLTKAYRAALGLGMRLEAAEAAAMLVAVVGDRLAKHEAGRTWAESAEPLARAAASPDALARYLNNIGNLDKSEGKYEQARVHHEQALALREQTLGPDHPQVGSSLINLGTVADAEGHYELARDYYTRALAIWERALGPDHPDLAAPLNNLGQAAYAQGKYEQARTYHERGLAIHEQAFGPDHPDVAGSLTNLGNVAKSQGDYAEARTHHERALAIWERALGPDHPSVATSLTNLGNLALLEHDHARARAQHERALAILEAALGREHPAVASSLNNLGTVAFAAGDYERARDFHARALAIRETALGPDHPSLASALTGLGAALTRLDAPDEAIVVLERALALRSNHEGDPSALAETRFALARALAATREHTRARELAELAAKTYESAGAPAAVSLAEVRDWLAAHPG